MKILWQDLQANETKPVGKFDASLEECFHLVSEGYQNALPLVFGFQKDSQLGQCCNKARGGYLPTVPKKYPVNAWFSYNDKTCMYKCQVEEYMYWAMTSILGAQVNRKDIGKVLKEWRLYSRSLVKNYDPCVYKLLTDEHYKLPKKLPKAG